MPELPEVEIIKRELQSAIRGKQIEDVVYDEKKLLRPGPSRFVEGLKGKRIKNVSRRAKLLIFELDDGSFFVCHLKLTGRLLYRQDLETEDDYVHVVLEFTDGTQLRFANARKFGYLHFFEDREGLVSETAKYGPEPLTDLTSDEFYRILQSTKRKIKILLMDQSQIAGVGNIYANDALWLAEINPKRSASGLSREEAGRLFESLEEVMEEALESGGSSDQWYRHTDGTMGSYQNDFKVYDQKGKECRRCGEEIVYDKVGGRGTFYCPKCQKL